MEFDEVLMVVLVLMYRRGMGRLFMGGGESVTVGRNTMKQPRFWRKVTMCSSLVMMKVFVDAVLEKVAIEKRLSLVKAWEESEKSTAENKNFSYNSEICKRLTRECMLKEEIEKSKAENKNFSYNSETCKRLTRECMLKEEIEMSKAENKNFSYNSEICKRLTRECMLKEEIEMSKAENKNFSYNSEICKRLTRECMLKEEIEKSKAENK
ncbi:hypothetical protein KIW84_015540 [Lathyrus oleraceus]|uniref:Uncharacterized protein n=1 Tax=Pisum sativum TaxID=3888 RepID=A0A9D5BR41_PEA|nr:hypothetical protein KIW84_015540 [Pisum sativum]